MQRGAACRGVQHAEGHSIQVKLTSLLLGIHAGLAP